MASCIFILLYYEVLINEGAKPIALRPSTFYGSMVYRMCEMRKSSITNSEAKQAKKTYIFDGFRLIREVMIALNDMEQRKADYPFQPKVCSGHFSTVIRGGKSRHVEQIKAINARQAPFFTQSSSTTVKT